jgi:hypothetical protein
MDEKCRNCDEKQACVPFFVHEGIMDHYSRANRRMLIALLTVCITFIITIVIFTTSYTKREANWLDTLQRVGVTDGVHEQPDP